jgi:hypothetical protein
MASTGYYAPAGWSRLSYRHGAQISINWLQVLGTTETPHIDQGVRQQFHPIVALLDVFKTKKHALEFILPRKRPSDTGQPSPRHPLLWWGMNSTVFGKYPLDQHPEPHGT